MKHKTWNAAKLQIRICGTCLMCDKKLMSNEGGWIINANKDYFCENHKANEHSCFDEYLRQRKEWEELNK